MPQEFYGFFFVTQLTFPDCKHTPLISAEIFYGPTVTNDVAGSLALPESAVLRWRGTAAPARMAVPKAPMYENHLSVPRQDEIGAAGQLSYVQSESIAHRMHQSTDHSFRHRVNGANTRHAIASLSRTEVVSHVNGHSARFRALVASLRPQIPKKSH